MILVRVEGPAMAAVAAFRDLRVVVTVTSGSVARLLAVAFVLARTAEGRAVEATLATDASESESEVGAIDGSGMTRRLGRVGCPKALTLLLPPRELLAAE